MLIYVLRHAWADHSGAGHWSSDDQRPLTDEGRTRFVQVTRRLIARGFAPEVIATSPLVRCRQTSETLVEHVESEPEIVTLPELSPNSDMAAIVRWTREQQAEQLAWVGHSPDVGFLTASLLGDCAAVERFAPGSCAAIEIDADIPMGGGRLCWLADTRRMEL